jgi:hypothetical protein
LAAAGFFVIGPAGRRAAVFGCSSHSVTERLSRSRTEDTFSFARI